MSQYYYYSKVLAQLSAIFYCAGCPRDTCICPNYHYNDDYDTKLDALEAYNNYVNYKAKSFKHIFQMQLERNLNKDWMYSKKFRKEFGNGSGI